MRIAVSADSANGLNSRVSLHFGRCPFFVLVDIDEDGTIRNVTSVANPCYGNHAPGQVPAFINSQGVNVMVSGGMGAGAISFFNQYGIGVATGASGTVADAIEAYFDGALSADAVCSHDHHAGCH
ncbi:MAG: NifB/NifX family molybdenum-iron cluster-binding protein [Chloroflexota bacterium]